jgi:hypothetical protein
MVEGVPGGGQRGELGVEGTRRQAEARRDTEAEAGEGVERCGLAADEAGVAVDGTQPGENRRIRTRHPAPPSGSQASATCRRAGPG